MEVHWMTSDCLDWSNHADVYSGDKSSVGVLCKL